jgi:hypothetical protein
MAEPVTPPDLIGAGVAQPQGTPPESLMSQLRTPALSPEMAGMMSMPRQTPGQAYASALAGGVAQMQGQPNPVMQQQQAHQQQSMQYAQMAERVQAARMAREQGILGISKDLLQSESQEARMVGARGMLNFAKNNGLPVQDIEPLVKGMALKRFDMNAVLKDLELGLDDPTILMRYQGMDPQTLQAARKNLQNDTVRRAAGLKTSMETKKEALEVKKLEAEAMEADFPELKGNAELQLAVEMAHRKINAGKGYREGDKDTQRVAYEMALDQVRSVKERELAIREASEARKAMDSARNRQMMEQLLGGQGPLGGGGGFEPSVSIGPSGPTVSFKPQTKTKEELAGLQQTEAIFDSVRQMSESLITAKTAPEALLQGVKLSAGAAVKSNTLAAAYQDSKQAFLGVLSRTLGGERGVLTDRDIARIDKMLPGFADTKAVRDLKIGLIDNLLKTSIEAKNSMLAGQPVSGGYRKRIEKLLREAEGPAAPRAKLSRQQYDALRQKGYSDEQIMEKYEVTR